MAIEVLAAYLTLHFPGDAILIQYVDDILLVSADPHRLYLETTMLAEDLHEAGWIVSPKSRVITATNVSWMGKEVGRYLRELGMPPLTLQEEGLTKGTSCPSHCPMSGAS